MRSSLLLAGLLALACTSGCERLQPEPPEAAVVFCLFDISGSTSSPQVRQRYLTEFEKLLGGLEDGDAVVGDLITANSLATATYPISAELPIKGLLDNPLTYKSKVDEAISRARAQAEALILNGPPAEASDLVSALYLAEKVLTGETHAGRPIKALVIFSDMILQHGDYDFTGIDLTDQRIKEIISAEKDAQGGLPNLSGVRVWVVGAGAAPEGGQDPVRLRQIEDFWRQYFAACGAELPSSHYGATLLNFNLHPQSAGVDGDAGE